MENLHPIVVHFPIALLTLYSILEILSLFRKVRDSKTVWYIKLFLLIVWLLSVQAALTTGEIAGDAWRGIRNILEWHETFANASLRCYGIAAIGYIWQWFLYDGITTRWWQKIIGSTLHMIIQKIVFLYKKTRILFILAIGGIAALTITGALWGAMVYGTQADPMVELVIKLLHISN